MPGGDISLRHCTLLVGVFMPVDPVECHLEVNEPGSRTTLALELREDDVFLVRKPLDAAWMPLCGKRRVSYWLLCPRHPAQYSESLGPGGSEAKTHPSSWSTCKLLSHFLAWPLRH